MELFVLVMGGVAVYMLPWVIAAMRGHHQMNAIGALTILRGWTFIGWAVAIVWSLTQVRAEE